MRRASSGHDAAPKKPRRQRVALVLKRSAYRIWALEKRDPHYVKMLAGNKGAARTLREAHEEHEATVREVKAVLRAARAEVMLVHDTSSRFDADALGLDLVVTVGGDGTLLAASHSCGRVPVLGVNSAPGHSVGFFSCAARKSASGCIEAALAGELEPTWLTRMAVTMNGALVSGRVLNDALFCHASPASTTRYVLEVNGVREEQRSSGIWVGPAAGSTAAQRSAGGRVLPLQSKRLQLVVREPYLAPGATLLVRRALIAPGERLVVRSRAHDSRLFLDGPNVPHAVGYGDELAFEAAREPLALLGLGPDKRRVRISRSG